MLAVDPGTIKCGYAIIKKEYPKITLLEASTLSYKGSLPLKERVWRIYKDLDARIQNWKVDHITLETPFLGKNVQSFLKLGYIRGALYILAQEYQCDLKEYAPAVIKSYLTRNPHASKDDIQKALRGLFPHININEEDTADAIALGYVALWKNDE